MERCSAAARGEVRIKEEGLGVLNERKQTKWKGGAKSGRAGLGKEKATSLYNNDCCWLRSPSLFVLASHTFGVESLRLASV